MKKHDIKNLFGYIIIVFIGAIITPYILKIILKYLPGEMIGEVSDWITFMSTLIAATIAIIGISYQIKRQHDLDNINMRLGAIIYFEYILEDIIPSNLELSRHVGKDRLEIDSYLIGNGEYYILSDEQKKIYLEMYKRISYQEIGIELLKILNIINYIDSSIKFIVNESNSKKIKEDFNKLISYLEPNPQNRYSNNPYKTHKELADEIQKAKKDIKENGYSISELKGLYWHSLRKYNEDSNKNNFKKLFKNMDDLIKKITSKLSTLDDLQKADKWLSNFLLFQSKYSKLEELFKLDINTNSYYFLSEMNIEVLKKLKKEKERMKKIIG